MRNRLYFLSYALKPQTVPAMIAAGTVCFYTWSWSEKNVPCRKKRKKLFSLVERPILRYNYKANTMLYTEGGQKSLSVNIFNRRF